MLEINKRYMRISSDKEESLAVIRNEKDLAYHEYLRAKGFEYKEIAEVQPRGNVCFSCEG